MREAGSLVNDAMGYLLKLNAPSGKVTEHNNDEWERIKGHHIPKLI